MAESEGLIGFGTKVRMWDDEQSPPGLREVGEVKDVTPPSETMDTVEVSHMQSPDGYKEFILGMTDAGELSFDINWIPGMATDVFLRRVRAAKQRIPVQVEYPNGAMHDFHALLMSLTPAVPVQDVMTQSVNFKVTGPVVPSGPGSP